MTPSPVSGSNTARHLLFLATWFVFAPLLAALALVVFLSGPADTEIGSGMFAALRNFARQQPIPLGILAFTVFEMVCWSYRHLLPGASAAKFGGRGGLPRDLRRPYEAAKQALDEAERIWLRRGREIERELSASERGEVRSALDELSSAMKAEPFERDRFFSAQAKAKENIDKYLGRWRKSEIREYGESITVAVGVALLLRAFAVEAFKIPSPSMVPTLQVGDHIFVNKSAYGPEIPFIGKRLFANLPPKYGDVIVFRYPENLSQDYIKRVVALPGDKLEALDGRPIINGWRPPECKVGTYNYSWGEGLASNHEGDLVIEYLGEHAYLVFYDSAYGADIDARRVCEQDGDCEPGLACRAGSCGDLQGPFYLDSEEVWVMGDNRNNSHDSRAWGGVPYAHLKGRALFVWMSFGEQGGVAWDRMGVNVMGRPKLPPNLAHLQPAVDRCFDERPPIEETTPPPPADR